MTELCNLQIHVNNQQMFFINENIMSTFSGKLKKMIKTQQNRDKMKNLCVKLDDFAGGANGFELISRFCYNNGVKITVSNVSILHYCCAVYLDMNSKVFKTESLLQQTGFFLEGMFNWSFNDVLVCLKSLDSFSDYADSIGFFKKMIFFLIEKISNNFSSSSFSSSSENGPTFTSSSKRPWWFKELTILPPKTIEKFVETFEAHGSENNRLLLTKFLIYYLKTTMRSKNKGNYGRLAEKAVNGVILDGKNEFSCRGVFWVMRVIVSGFDLDKAFKNGIERLIGEMLDKATLDDLLVSSTYGCVYDVNLVIKLVRVFVHCDFNDHYAHLGVEKMKKVGKVIDEYLREISPDHNLKISKFLGVAESLPDSARESFDGVYRAIDIYLQSHPSLSMEERLNLCRCLNYEKLTLETCKDLAKNPKIPPRITVEALISQQIKVPIKAEDLLLVNFDGDKSRTKVKEYSEKDSCKSDNGDDVDDGEEMMRMNMEKMQWRIIELEKVCRNMKGQMVKLGTSNSVNNRGFPRLC